MNPGTVAPAVDVDPRVALIDVPRHVRIRGFAARSVVSLSASLRQFDGTSWCSEMSFVADAKGEIDLSRDEPVSGSYRGVAPMGLLWSMRREENEGQTPQAAGDKPRSAVDPIIVTVTARGADGRTAKTRFEQRFLGPGVTRREIREEGLVGTLFIPAGAGPHPAIIVLSGSSAR